MLMHVAPDGTITREFEYPKRPHCMVGRRTSCKYCQSYKQQTTKNMNINYSACYAQYHGRESDHLPSRIVAGDHLLLRFPVTV